MTKIQEIKKMFDYIAASDYKYDKHSNHSMQPIIKKNNEYTTDLLFSPTKDFNMGSDYAVSYCFINFDNSTITMFTEKESYHNGDYYDEKKKTMPIDILEDTYEQVKSIFFSVVQYEIKKEEIRKKQEAERKIVEDKMQEILNAT